MDIKPGAPNDLTYATDISSLAIWDSSSMQIIDSWDGYEDKLLKVYDKGNPELSGSTIVVETGMDGKFKIIIRKNEGPSEAEQKIIYKSSDAYKFKITSDVMVGSPEWAGYQEKEAIENNRIDRIIDMPHGDYIVEPYSLLTRKPDGSPQFMQFLFCIYEENKYNQDKPVRDFSKAIKLQYTG